WRATAHRAGRQRPPGASDVARSGSPHESTRVPLSGLHAHAVRAGKLGAAAGALRPACASRRQKVAGAPMTPYAAVLIVMIAFGALAFGSVYAWAYWPLAAGCAALGIVGMTSSRSWREGKSRALAWSLLAVVGVIAIQIVPLPFSLFARLSPGA